MCMYKDGGGGDCRPVSQKRDSQDTQILKRVGQNYRRRLYIYILVHKLHSIQYSTSLLLCIKTLPRLCRIICMSMLHLISSLPS